MPEVLIRRPLHKLKLPHEDGLEPPAVFHLRCRQALAPSPGLRLRQILKRTLRRLYAWNRWCIRDYHFWFAPRGCLHQGPSITHHSYNLAFRLQKRFQARHDQRVIIGQQ